MSKEEAVSPPITLYKNPNVGISTRAGEDDEYLSQFEEKKERTYNDFLIQLYDKVGAFYGWSLPEFLDTEYELIMLLNEDIDRKFKDAEEGIISWDQLFTQIAIARAFGGKKK